MVSVQSSQAGSGRIAGFCAKKAFASHLLLVHEGEHFRSWFPAAETTSQAAVPTEPEAAQTLLLQELESKQHSDDLKRRRKRNILLGRNDAHE